MAWTTPITWASAVYGASDFNVQIRDNQNYLRWQSARQSEDEAWTNNETAADCPNSRFHGQAGERWVFQGCIYVVTTAAADMAIAITAPVGSTGIYGLTGSAGSLDGYTTTFGTLIGTSINGTIEETVPFGGLVVFGRRGFVQVRAAQDTATAGVTTTLYDEAFIVAHRIT